MVAGKVEGYEGEYRLVGTYKDAEGNTALLIQDNDSIPYTHAVFTAEGDNKVFYASNFVQAVEALQQGKDFLAGLGFTPQEEAALNAEANVAVEEGVDGGRWDTDKASFIKTVATALNLPGFGITDEEFAESAVYANSEDVVVQDLSLAKWKAVGEINGGLIGDFLGHAHPDFGDRYVYTLSRAEIYAAALSFTAEERAWIEQEVNGGKTGTRRDGNVVGATYATRRYPAGR